MCFVHSFMLKVKGNIVREHSMVSVKFPVHAGRADVCLYWPVLYKRKGFKLQWTNFEILIQRRPYLSKGSLQVILRVNENSNQLVTDKG